MKLAEALQERADLNRKIDELRARLQNQALVQEGEKPAEDPDALLREMTESLDRLEYLMRQINKTNGVYTVEGETLTALIARKDRASTGISCMRHPSPPAAPGTRRYGSCLR